MELFTYSTTRLIVQSNTHTTIKNRDGTVGTTPNVDCTRYDKLKSLDIVNMAKIYGS